MIIQVKKFGTTLISRPEGRDAALVLKNQFLVNDKSKEITFDFSDIFLCTPSWLDEFLIEAIQKYGKENVKFANTTNSSVKASIEVVINS